MIDAGAIRTVLVEDDPMTSMLLQAALCRAGVDLVDTYDDGAVAARSIAAAEIDLLISDICLPGLSGLELARHLKRQNPTLRTMLITGTPTMELALQAYETRVDDLIVKPCRPTELAARIRALHIPRLVVLPQRVLAVGAHPDDVELGCGGALARHRLVGDDVVILTLTDGASGGDPAARRREAQEAARRLGASALHFGGLDDTMVPGSGKTVAVIEQVIREVRPTIIYTHSVHDFHQDHRAAHSATLIAGRSIKELLCYQSPSSSIDFRPTRFVDVSQTFDAKLAAIDAFVSQRERKYLTPAAVTAVATYWGRFADYGVVEPLEVVRQAV